MMQESIDLELSLHHRDAGPYMAELRSIRPKKDSDVEPLSGKGRVVQFDFDQLRALEQQSVEYGNLLARSLFADPELYADFTSARTDAQTHQYALRLQLLIGSSAPELHQLHWEALCDPHAGTPLFNGENILFSRYLLGSSDWRPVRPRSKGELRALIAVANPGGLERYEGFAPVDVAAETARARQALGSLPVSCLSELGTHRSSLNNLITYLRQEPCDLVYPVCHGSFSKDESYLWLEDETGQVQRVSGQELAAEIKDLAQRPLLMVLAACQSAAVSSNQALTAIGPRLAVAGVPAVLAMQGQISMETAAQFMPVLFDELQRDGHIDRAIAIARGAVRDRPDHWMPVLFTRLKSGRLWYVPGFQGDDFGKWPTLLNSIKSGRCTPILGPGLTEPVIGSLRELALQWAESAGYPMAPHERESLPQVAQYVAVDQDPIEARRQLTAYIRTEIQRRYKDSLTAELLSDTTPLDDLIEAVYAQHWTHDPDEPYRVLARLPVSVYVTANFNNLQARALELEHKTPHVKICPWVESLALTKPAFQAEPNYRPDKTEPLIYHLFGRLDEPDSIVLTEDDYFDYLIGVSSNDKIVPSDVQGALVSSALLFLGFQIDDWNLRTLLRYIASLQGRGLGLRKKITHVAAQIEPEEGRILQPARARKYLEKYFQDADISLYWGSAEEFLKELQDRLNKRPS